jgi:hypothetical protein
MITIRPARAATSWSWVTMTMVIFRSRLSRYTTRATWSGSRLPVGWSARSTSGELATARAMAARWRSPPDGSGGRRICWSSRPPRAPARSPAPPGRARPDQRHGKLDVVSDGSLREQVVQLKDDADRTSPYRSRSGWARRSVVSKSTWPLVGVSRAANSCSRRSCPSRSCR